MGRFVIIITCMIVLFGGLAIAGEKNTNAVDIVDRFDVRWSSARYNKSVVVYNPVVSSSQEEMSEGLSLGCEIEILDPNLVLGTSRECTVTQLTDGQGREITVSPPRRHRGFGWPYQELEYHMRFEQPPKPPRWKAWLQSVLKLSRNKSRRPREVMELQPSRFSIPLPRELLERGGTKIGRVKGYFHVLMAESYTYIDVPFEPNDNWIRLLPDVEIQVRQAECDGNTYHYRIETRSPGDRHVGPIRIGDVLPDRMVADRQLIGADGKPVHPPHHSPFMMVSVGGGASGSVGGTGGNLSIQCIRYTIAVHPTDRAVPFELEHIPLPNPGR